MTIYAMIESNSGFFWGAVDADDPIEACRRLEQKVDPHAAGCRTYEEVSPGSLGSGYGPSGYHVHHIDDVTDAEGINALDGEDPTVISMIYAYRLVADVQVTEG